MDYEKDGEDYVARGEDGSVALRYRKVPTRYRATATEVIRDHHELASVYAFGGGLTPRDDELDGPRSQKVITLRVQEDSKNPLRAIPPKPWQFVSPPTHVVLRNHPGATGNVFYSQDERLYSPDTRFGPTPFVDITCYVEPEVLDRLWADIEARPESVVTVEVIADLYQEETEIRYNEADNTDHLYYAPDDWSISKPYPHVVHSVSVSVADVRRPPLNLDTVLEGFETKPAPRHVSARTLLSDQLKLLNRSLGFIVFLLAAIAVAVVFK